MVAFPIAQHLKLALAPLIGGALGLVFALAVIAVPGATLEAIVTAIGLPSIFPAAEAPLGLTARAVLAGIGGLGIAVASWGALLVVVGAQSIRIPLSGFRVPRPAATSRMRRADAHPDSPVRAPLMATRDLGTPFLEVKAKPAPLIVRDLPADLDAPLSAYDPAAIPAAPAEPIRPVASLVRKPVACAPGERIETFELARPTPTVAARQPGAIVRPRTDATIHALLDRLEAGVRREPGRRAAG